MDLLEKLPMLLLLPRIFCGILDFTVRLKSDKYHTLGSQVNLICEYNVPLDRIHKVVWLKSDRKIFQYVNGRNPPFRNYSLSGADINWAASNESQFALQNVRFKASGLYRCAVTTDTPIYTKYSEETHLTVVEVQTENPKITWNDTKSRLTVGQWLKVNCTSGVAHPIPELTWLLNENPVEKELLKSFLEINGTTWTVQLKMEIKDVREPILKLTCLSTIPGFLGSRALAHQYADYRSNFITIHVVNESTTTNDFYRIYKLLAMLIIYLVRWK